MKRLSPHFGQELAAAGLGDAVAFSSEGELWIQRFLTQDERDALAAIYEAHDYRAKAPNGSKPDYSKAQLFSEMTNAEFDLYEYIALSQNGRERAIFENTTAIQPHHPLYQKFEQLVLQAYGQTRGKELLEAAAIKP